MLGNNGKNQRISKASNAELEAWLDGLAGRIYLKIMEQINGMGGDCVSAKNPAYIISRLADAADNGYVPWPDTPPVYPDLYEVKIPIPAWQYYHVKRQDSERRLEEALRQHIAEQGGTVSRLRVSMMPAGLWDRYVSIDTSFLPEAQLGGAAGQAQVTSAKPAAANVRPSADAPTVAYPMSRGGGGDTTECDTVLKPAAAAVESLPKEGLSRGAYVSCPGLRRAKLQGYSTFGEFEDGHECPTIVLPRPQFAGTTFMAGLFARNGSTWRVTAYTEGGLDVKRGSDRVHLSKGEAVELEDGDSIFLSNQSGAILPTALTFNLVA